MRALTVSALLLLLAPSALAGNEGVPDRLAALEARVAELESDRDACDAEVETLAAEVDALEAEVSETRRDVDQALIDVGLYQEIVAELAARIPVYEPEWTDLNERVDALEVQVADLNGAVLDMLGCVEAWMNGDACGGETEANTGADDGADGQPPSGD